MAVARSRGTSGRRRENPAAVEPRGHRRAGRASDGRLTNPSEPFARCGRAGLSIPAARMPLPRPVGFRFLNHPIVFPHRPSQSFTILSDAQFSQGCAFRRPLIYLQPMRYPFLTLDLIAGHAVVSERLEYSPNDRHKPETDRFPCANSDATDRQPPAARSVSFGGLRARVARARRRHREDADDRGGPRPPARSAQDGRRQIRGRHR